METPPPDSPRFVLVVDDDPLVAEFLQILLSRQGFQPAVHLDPEAALAWTAQHADKIDIAVLDYLLPRMNGLELARRLRQMSPRLPLILLTGMVATPDFVENAEWQPYLAMHKPFRAAELKANIELLLGREPKVVSTT